MLSSQYSYSTDWKHWVIILYVKKTHNDRYIKKRKAWTNQFEFFYLFWRNRTCGEGVKGRTRSSTNPSPPHRVIKITTGHWSWAVMCLHKKLIGKLSISLRSLLQFKYPRSAPVTACSTRQTDQPDTVLMKGMIKPMRICTRRGIVSAVERVPRWPQPAPQRNVVVPCLRVGLKANIRQILTNWSTAQCVSTTAFSKIVVKQNKSSKFVSATDFFVYNLTAPSTPSGVGFSVRFCGNQSFAGTCYTLSFYKKPSLHFFFIKNKLNKNSKTQIAWKIRTNWEQFEAEMKILRKKLTKMAKRSKQSHSALHSKWVLLLVLQLYNTNNIYMYCRRRIQMQSIQKHLKAFNLIFSH